MIAAIPEKISFHIEILDNRHVLWLHGAIDVQPKTRGRKMPNKYAIVKEEM